MGPGHVNLDVPGRVHWLIDAKLLHSMIPIRNMIERRRSQIQHQQPQATSTVRGPRGDGAGATARPIPWLETTIAMAAMAPRDDALMHCTSASYYAAVQ